MAYYLLFSYFRHNFVANYDAMNCTSQSEKHDLVTLNFFAVLCKIMTTFNATYATHPL